jgi:hypothetical protein
VNVEQEIERIAAEQAQQTPHLQAVRPLATPAPLPTPGPGAARDGTPYPAPNPPLQPKTPDQALPRPMSTSAP